MTRLAPEDPMPRREMPWVVGFATSDELRRNRLKPGTSRSRSSRFAPGVWSNSLESSTETLAGVSAEIFSTTVMVVFTGSSGFGGPGGSWAANGNGQNIRTKDTGANPAALVKAPRRGGEHDFEAGLIQRTFQSV